MALVLAIEPNAVQADTLRHVLRTRADTDVVIVESTDTAVAAVDARVPDLVLVGALLSPRDEDTFIAHLRTLPDAGHLQTLTIPQLRQPSDDARRWGPIFSKRKRRRADETAGGCDPTRFGDEVAAYLSRACEVKAEIEQRKVAVGEAPPHVADLSEPAGSRSSASAEGPLPQSASRSIDPGAGLTSALDEGEAVHHPVATSREGCTPGQAETTATLAAELDRMRADAERTLAAELAAAEERHRADIACLETGAAESRAAAALEAQAAAEALAAQTLAAELDGVRNDAARTLAAELRAAEERHGAEIARLEAEAAEKGDAADRDGQAAQRLAAELDAVRADAARTLAAELAAAEERHGAEIARLEAEAAEKGDAAAHDGQAAQRLAAELDGVRADAVRKLAAELAAAAERHGTEIARLEAETAEKGDAAARDGQAVQQLAAELDEVRADAARTLAAELRAAEERHGAEVARLEAEAAEKGDAAARDGQAAQRLAAELDGVRADAARTVSAELGAAKERHGAEIARLETAAAENRAAAARDAQTAAEAQAGQRLAAELDAVRADAARTLAAELAAAAERHGAEMGQVRVDARKTFEVRLEQIQAEANLTRAEASRHAAELQAAVAREARVVADHDPQPTGAPATSISPTLFLEPVPGDKADAGGVTDYYNLWRRRFAAANAPPVEVSVTRTPRDNPRRRRWALSAAAALLILLINNPESGSAPRHKVAAVEAASVSHAIAPTGPRGQDGVTTAPDPGGVGRHDPGEPATGDNPKTGMSSRAPLSMLVLEIMCVLAVILLLRVALFVGEGLVWHGLIVTLGLILLGFVVMRAPWAG